MILHLLELHEEIALAHGVELKEELGLVMSLFVRDDVREVGMLHERSWLLSRIIVHIHGGDLLLLLPVLVAEEERGHQVLLIFTGLEQKVIQFLKGSLCIDVQFATEIIDFVAQYNKVVNHSILHHIARNDATIGIADKVKNIFTLWALRDLCLDMLASMGGVVATGVDEAIDLLNVKDLLTGEATATEAYGVETHVLGRTAAYHGIWRDVLGQTRATLDHAVAADVSELVDQSAATDDCAWIDNDLTGHLYRVRHDHTVTDITIVSHVAVSHDEAVLADLGYLLRGSCAVYGHTLVELCAIANLDGSVLALELEVLWGSSDTSAREDVTVLADASTRKDSYIVLDDGAIANDGVTIDARERSDLYAFADLSTFLDICERRN